MKKVNTIVILAILIIIIAFLLGFSVAKNKDANINQNINTVSIGSLENQKQMVNINTADKDELLSIKGIGPKKADLIIAYRPYKSIWDLANINGISEDFIQEIKEGITIG